MNLDKLTKYIKENPTSDDTNLKKLNVLNERELNKTKSDIKKMEKLLKRRERVDKKIKKLIKNTGL